MDIISVVSALVSLILGGFSIWISLYFYNQGKISEKNTAIALENIKTQTNSLEKLSGRYLDRLTKYVIESKPNDYSVLEIIRELKVYPGNTLEELHRNNDSTTVLDKNVLLLALCYYTAMCNYWSQAYMAKTYHEEEKHIDIAQIASYIDESHKDFNILDSEIWAMPLATLKEVPNYHLVDKIKNVKQFIKTSEELSVTLEDLTN